MSRYVVVVLLLFLAAVSGAASAGSGCIGAMVDDTSRAGKEEKLAMEMAMEDFTAKVGDVASSSSVVELCTMASNGDPVRAASAALSLINERGARALVGLHSWQEAAFVAEIGRQAMVPVLSFATAAPPSPSRRWPFLVRVARDQHAQMRAVAAVVGSWQWRRVAVLYEDVDYGAAGAGVFPHLADALRAVGSEVDRRVPVPASPSDDALRRSLGDLMGGQCRVFVVHTSAKVAAALFAEASRMGMMATGYVWIVTDAIAGAVDSLDAATVSTMQGVIGVRNHNSMDTNSKNTRDHLIARFRKRFRSQYPGDDGDDDDEETRGPHFQALLAYDTIVAVASSMRKINATSPTRATDPNPSSPTADSGETIKIAVSSNGTDLLREIKSVRFRGVSGKFRFVDGEFAPPESFQLINVAAPRYHELGFWSPEHGFSKSAGCCSRSGGGGEPSMRFLGPVIWPGKPWDVPRGWAPANGSPFTVAVPEKAVFPDFVKVTRQHGRDDDDDPSFEGFSIDVFKAAVEHLPYNFHYKFVSFNETYDSLMQHDYMKSYDILVGDTSISSGRYKFVEFSQPYTEPGLVMVVPFMANAWDRSWIFLRPFSSSMWLMIIAIGFLSKVSMVVWLFVAVVLMTNYTASLSSLMTTQRLGKDAVTAELLRATGAAVGCSKGSVVGKYLEEVLMFPAHRIRRFAGDEDHHRALVSGEVKAAFLRVSHAKLLLAKYCNELMTTGPVYHVAGLGFVFPKGSPLLADISQAILEVFESGTIQRLETAMLSAYNCTPAADRDGDDAGDLYRLGPENYWGLFLMTLFASTASLAVYGVFFHHDTTCSGGGATGGHRPGDGRRDSATVDPGGGGGGGHGDGDEAPSSASGSAEHGGKDTEMVVISMECELTACPCLPQQK
uniref:Glutamate receptor n=1 Tax=Oryza punctata TaxID=4537 RepID=A0A0E0L825_ORYPU